MAVLEAKGNWLAMIKFLTGEDQLMFLLSVFEEAGGEFNIISISLAKLKR